MNNHSTDTTLIYLSIINKAIKRLIAKPEKHIGLDFKSYADKKQETFIGYGLAVWESFDADSLFYRKILRYSLPLSLYDEELYNEAVELTIKRRLEGIRDVVHQERNSYKKVVYIIHLLPTKIFRKWLWHYNVDFQGRESFLRRLTREQMDSLFEHWDLYQKDIPTEQLPCFSEGWVNKVWQFFGLPYWFGERMDKKSALAYDFGGTGMGFQLYPTKTDEKADETLANQFFDSSSMSDSFWSLLGLDSVQYKAENNKPKGDFEVNKESGLYWYLYKTMRSNWFYNRDKTVVLGKHICPGVWATFSFWTFLLIVSPTCLIFVLLQSLFTGTASIPLLIMGTISPTVFTLSYVITWLSKNFDEDYIDSVKICTFVLVVAMLLSFVLNTIGWFTWSALMLYITIVTIVPYCIKKESLRFWETPIVGKVVPILFLTFLSWNYISLDWILGSLGYLFAQTWLLFWKFVFWLAISGYGLTFLFVAFAVYGSISLFKKADHTFSNMIRTDNREADGFIYLCQAISLSLAVIVFLTISGFFANGNFDLLGGFISNISKIQALLVFYFTLIPLLVLFFTFTDLKLSRVFFNDLSQENEDFAKEKEGFKGIREAINNNKFLSGMNVAYEIKLKIIGSIINRSYYYRKLLPWSEIAFRKISNLQELVSFKEAIDIGEIRYNLPDKVDEDIIDLILAGKWTEEAQKLLQTTIEEQSAIKNKSVLMDFIEKTFIGKVLAKGSSFLKLIQKIVNDFWYFLRGIYKFCPRSPADYTETIR